MLTKAFTDEPYKGNDMYKIYEVDSEGNKVFEFDRKTGEKVVKKPLISIGLKKAQIILNNVESLENFVTLLEN